MTQPVFQPGDTSLKRAELLARVILDLDAEIYALAEVQGEESLREFNHHFLQDAFHISLIEGNSDRGIHLAYLIKKNLPYHFEHLTHRRRPLPNAPTLLLSRDIAELRLKCPETEQVLLVLLAVHLKSKRTDQSSDFGGKRRRARELELVVQTHKTLAKRFGPQIPVVLMGDFNGIAQPDHFEEEFAPLMKSTELIDILEYLNLPKAERITQVSFGKNRELLAEQFDYIFFPTKLGPWVNPAESGVYRFKNGEGQPLPLPQGPSERAELPSDHYPVVLSLKPTLFLSAGEAPAH